MSRMINDPTLADIWGDIEQGMERSSQLHRHYSTAGTLRRAALVVEEAAEALTAALDATRPAALANGDAQPKRDQHLAKIYTETVECAVVAILHLSAIRKERAMKDKSNVG